MSSIYVLYDPLHNAYLNGHTTVASWRDAKSYKRLGSAISPITGAGLLNTDRNLPPGVTQPNKHYQNLPNVEVHELTESGYFLRSHAAPPSYIII